MRLLLTYKEVVRVGSFAQELVDMSKNIKRISSMLSNAKECEFVGVAIPERMSLEETERLAHSLAQLKVAMRRLLINNVVADDVARACDFCASRRRGQQRNIKAFQRTFEGRATLFSAPQEPYEVRGPGRLLEHFSKWEQLPGTDAGH
jgi:anion-transporting  ArsA/GET3 family ATPase